MEDISRFVCCTLDHIGYNREIIELRRNCWRECTRIFNEKIFSNYEKSMTIAGSKAEGITALFESDLDVMHLMNDVICTDNVEPSLQLPRMTTFHTDTMNTSPGYTKLKMITSNGDSRLQESLFREDSGEIFASSTIFASHYDRRMQMDTSHAMTVHDLSGPATPISSHLGLMTDQVIALLCINSYALQPFRTRHRQHDWPPLGIIQDESSAICQLVPVGYKGSRDQWKEWRFCFIQTEMNLTHSLNDTQIKLYIVLKMIAKNILKCVSNEISSYIMKNITYWISEKLGSHIFREENIIALMFVALRFLKVSVDENFLPYYMIPGRNLLAERLEPSTRRDLSYLISQLLDEGPRLLMRCEKLRVGMTVMYISPEMLVDYKNEKELVERMCIPGLSTIGRMLSDRINGPGDEEILENSIMGLIRLLVETNGIDKMQQFIKLLS